MVGDNVPELPSPLRRGGHPPIRHPANLEALSMRRLVTTSRWGVCTLCETLAVAQADDQSKWGHVYAGTLGCTQGPDGPGFVAFDNTGQDWFLLTPAELLRELEYVAGAVPPSRFAELTAALVRRARL